MKKPQIQFLLVALLGLLLAGCATAPTLTPNRLLPWNWFKPDPLAKVAKAEAQIESSKLQLLELSQQLYLAALRELELDPHPSVYLTHAMDYLHRGQDNQAAALGPIPPETVRAVELMVAQRASEDPAEKIKGDKALAAIDRLSENYSKRLALAEEAIDAAHEATAKAFTRARTAEEKYDRIWFWIWCAVIGYVALQILPGIAKFFPALAPVAKLAGWVAGPVVQASYSQLRAAVGTVIQTAEKTGQLGVEALRERLNAKVSEDEQDELHRHYTAAKLEAARAPQPAP